MLDEDLRLFRTVVECNSFSRAAKQLHLTQSAVSQHIRRLEEHYGVKLFDRLYRRIVITEAGKMLYPFALEVEELYQRIDDGMQRLTGDISGAIHIAASLTLGEYLLPGYLIRFQQAYPGVRITMEVENSEQVAELVAGSAVELGFIEGPVGLPEEIEQLPCGGDELYIVAAPTWPRPARPVSLGSLLDSDWVMRERTSGTRQVFERFIDEQGLREKPIHVAMELASTEAVKQAVCCGVGIAAVSSLTVATELAAGTMVRIPVVEGPIARNFSLIYHRDRFWTLAVERFRTFIEAGLVDGKYPESQAPEQTEQD